MTVERLVVSTTKIHRVMCGATGLEPAFDGSDPLRIHFRHAPHMRGRERERDVLRNSTFVNFTPFNFLIASI